MKDSLGDRMKNFYENRTRLFLPRRTYTIIRIDGKAFHTYTKGLEKPFDVNLITDMNNTARVLLKEIQGAKVAYVQSDEISLVLTDFDNLDTSSWFDGNIQKMASVSSSIATAAFNNYRMGLNKYFLSAQKLAYFDARVFTIPTKTEVINYLIWRQQDAVRNSISSLAQSLYSHGELNGKKSNEMQEMCFQKGTNWNNLHSWYKRGRFIDREAIWEETPDFNKQREVINILIPNNE